jgi:DNA-binding transcriptional LysR family regulator
MKTIKNLQSIAAFEKVAKLQSFSLAAKELEVSKAYISSLIQNLENQLGHRLFNRSTRAVKLTTAGEKLYSACSVSLYNISKAQEEMIENADTPHGKLKISLAGAFAEDYVTPFITDFIKRYPRVNVELHFEEKLVDLVEESYDIAIRVGQLKDSSLIAKRIAKRKEYICATPSFIKLHGQPKHPDDLKNYNCISAKDTWRMTIDGKQTSVPVSTNFKSNNGRSLLKAALADLGLCMLPGVYVKDHIESGRLIPILEKYTPTEIPIWAMTPSKKNMPVSVKFFLAEIENQFNHSLF